MMHTASRLLLVTASAATALSAACATATTPAARRASHEIFTSETSRPDSVVVRVVNHVAQPVTVYRVRDGARAALGQVKAGAEGRFPVRAADVAGSHVSLAAVPVGERTTVESAPFKVQRGQVAVFLITPELGGSQVFVDWPTR